MFHQFLHFYSSKTGKPSAKRWDTCQKKTSLPKLKNSSDNLHNPHNLHQGFSLIEVCVAISIVIAIATFCIPIKGFFYKQVLRNDVENLFTTINFLQQKAITCNKKLSLSIDTKKNYYFYKINNKVIAQKLSRNVKFAYLPDNKGVTFRNKEIIFYPSGRISSGTVYFEYESRYFAAITCPVSQVSFVRKYFYPMDTIKK